MLFALELSAVLPLIGVGFIHANALYLQGFSLMTSQWKQDHVPNPAPLAASHHDPHQTLHQYAGGEAGGGGGQARRLVAEQGPARTPSVMCCQPSRHCRYTCFELVNEWLQERVAGCSLIDSPICSSTDQHSTAQHSTAQLSYRVKDILPMPTTMPTPTGAAKQFMLASRYREAWDCHANLPP